MTPREYYEKEVLNGKPVHCQLQFVQVKGQLTGVYEVDSMYFEWLESILQSEFERKRE